MQSSEINQNSKISPLGDEIYCPLCQSYTRFLKVPKAAQLASVDRRTIYRYVETGDVYPIRIAGKNIRVCGGCLFKGERSSR